MLRDSSFLVLHFRKKIIGYLSLFCFYLFDYHVPFNEIVGSISDERRFVVNSYYELSNRNAEYT